MNLISLTDLIKQSWRLYKNNFKTLISITAWLLIFVLLQMLLFILTLTGKLAAVAFFGFLVLIASIAAAIVMSIILIQVINKIYHQEPIGNWNDLIKPAINKIGSYLLIAIINTVLVVVGLVLLIVPGIIIAVWYSLGAQVFVLENIRGYAALKRSKELVEGYWWPVLGRWLGVSLFFGIIIWIINAVVLFPLGINRFVPAITMNAILGEQTKWQEDLISGIISILVIPLFTTVGVILYNNLKQIKSTPAKNQPTTE